MVCVAEWKMNRKATLSEPPVSAAQWTVTA